MALAWVAKNLRLCKPGMEGKTNTTILLKEQANELIPINTLLGHYQKSLASSSRWDQIPRPGARQYIESENP